MLSNEEEQLIVKNLIIKIEILLEDYLWTYENILSDTLFHCCYTLTEDKKDKDEILRVNHLL